MAPETVLITGASRGIGLEFVRQFLSLQNAPKLVFAACRDPSSASELRSMAEKNKSLKLIKLDVTNDDDISAAFKQTGSMIGDKGLNLLINNAGINSKADSGFLGNVTREKMQSHFDTNVTAPALVSKTFLPLLKKAADANPTMAPGSSRAAIVNISSVLASIERSLQMSGDMVHYRASKAALNMVSACMSVELRSSGIVVVALHPGWVKTDMGGEGADLQVADSVSNCLSTILNLSERSAGKLLNYDGTVIPW